MGSAIAENSASVSKNPATILIADDDFFVVELLKDYLTEGGYVVVSADSGENALSKIGALEIDLALIDLKMPGMDGLETIERMAELDPNLVTILMTGYPTLNSSIRAIRLGASDYILKPFKLDEVGAAINRAMKVRTTRVEANGLRILISELEKKLEEKKDVIKINMNLVRTSPSPDDRTKTLT